MRAQGDGCPPKPSPTADLVPIPKPLPRKAREGKGQAHHHNRDPPIDHPPPPQKTQQGPGKGEGQLRLGLQYRAVENIAGEEIESATQGLLLVSIIRAEGLGGDAKAGPLRFVSAKLSKPAREGAGAALRTRLVGDGSVSYDTPPLRGDAPRWMSDNKFTFYDVGLEVRGRGVLIGFGFWGLGRKPGDGRFVFLCFDRFWVLGFGVWGASRGTGVLFFSVLCSSFRVLSLVLLSRRRTRARVPQTMEKNRPRTSTNSPPHHTIPKRTSFRKPQKQTGHHRRLCRRKGHPHQRQPRRLFSARARGGPAPAAVALDESGAGGLLPPAVSVGGRGRGILRRHARGRDRVLALLVERKGSSFRFFVFFHQRRFPIAWFDPRPAFFSTPSHAFFLTSVAISTEPSASSTAPRLSPPKNKTHVSPPPPPPPPRASRSPRAGASHNPPCPTTARQQTLVSRAGFAQNARALSPRQFNVALCLGRTKHTQDTPRNNTVAIKNRYRPVFLFRFFQGKKGRKRGLGHAPRAEGARRKEMQCKTRPAKEHHRAARGAAMATAAAAAPSVAVGNRGAATAAAAAGGG